MPEPTGYHEGWGRSAAGGVRRLLGGSLSVVFPTVTELELPQAVEEGWRVDPPDAYCHRCGASAGPGGATADGCAFCIGRAVPWDRLVRLGVYREPLSRWVVSMKFASRWTWARWFGDRLADAVAGPDERVVVCPVPMPWVRRVGRGYNQARLIASAMAKGRGWPVAPLLHRTRYSPAQTSVPVAQRKANVTGAFGLAKADLSGWDVWLVDDVKTTGSTLAACTRLLRRAGARRVRVAVAAVADPHGGGFQHL